MVALNEGQARPRVKICGLTNLEDARAAIEAGADLLGFNFYRGSKRYLEPSACSRMVRRLRQEYGNELNRVTLVGVFVNAAPTAIGGILDVCGLDLAQLHGDEPAADLERMGERAYKAIRLDGKRAPEEWLSAYPARRLPPALLLDAAVPGEYGGTGQTADWARAAALARQTSILLAGGLTPDNVARAIQIVQPWGVDVASGVESAPGKKDPRKMQQLIQAAGGMRRAVIPERS